MGKARLSTLVTMLFLAFVLPCIADEWTPIIDPDAPDARHGHSMVTLPSGEIILFAGRGPQGDMENDLWGYGSGAWRQIVPVNDPPTARYGHAAWSSGNNMYVYGGRDANDTFGDLWRYDPDTNEWQEVNTTGNPPTTSEHTAAARPGGGAYLLGGLDENDNPLPNFGTITDNGVYTPLTDCPSAYAHHVAELLGDDFLLVFGQPNLLNMYNAGTWSVAAGGPPLSGQAKSLIQQASGSGSLIFIFGGLDDEGQESRQVYEYNIDTGELHTRTELMPQTVYDGAVAALPAPDGGKADGPLHVLFFGGISDGEVVGDAFMFSSNGNALPAITVLEPNGDDTADTVFTIVWQAFDPDDDAAINLFYDTDNTGFDGQAINDTPLSEDNDTEFAWDVSQLPGGDYWVYATIADGENEVVRVYSAGSLTVDNPVDDDDDDAVEDDDNDDNDNDDDTSPNVDDDDATGDDDIITDDDDNDAQPNGDDDDDDSCGC